jgi:hypothetical protein
MINHPLALAILDILEELDETRLTSVYGFDVYPPAAIQIDPETWSVTSDYDWAGAAPLDECILAWKRAGHPRTLDVSRETKMRAALEATLVYLQPAWSKDDCATFERLTGSGDVTSRTLSLFIREVLK